MKTRHIIPKAAVVAICALVLAWAVAPQKVHAHCDTLSGPVITAARTALEKGDVKPILKWVQSKDESQIKAAFEKTLAVRKLSPAAKDLADMYLFETLVRIHRAGEGEPYTGLKPAEAVEPGIAAADEALESGSVDKLVREITEKVGGGIKERFKHAVEAKRHADESVEAGRQYVRAYVEFIHYVEGIHTTSLGTSPHGGESAHAEPAEEHKH